MRILVLNQYFHPDRSATSQLLTELCVDLARFHEVWVVTGRPSYNPTGTTSSRGLVSRERHGDVRVARVWSTGFPRANMAGRLTNYGTYLVSSVVGAFSLPRPDVVMSLTDPPPVGLIAALVSALRRRPFVLVTEDVFPDVAIRMGRLSNPALIRILRAMAALLFRRADRIVSIGRDMDRRLIDLGVPREKLTTIPNWSDGQQVQPLETASTLRSEQGWDERFVVMHSGNVGLSQSLDTFVDAAGLLRDHSDIVFAIVGDGAAKAGLQRRAQELGLSNVLFMPYQEKATLSQSLGAADVHYVGLRRGLAGFIVPSKVYGILAAGKPFIAAVEAGAEPALIAQESGCGIVVDLDDAAAVADAVLRMQGEALQEMGSRGRAVFENRFDRPIATDTYRRVLEGVTGIRAERRDRRRDGDV